MRLKTSKRGIKEIEYLLPKIKQHMVDTYGGRLESVVLFGSFAKNNATSGSDIDIAIILKGDVNTSREIDRIIGFISDTGLEHDELISILPVSSDDIDNSAWPLYKSLREEGVAI
ncbi:MAG: hypothetical protein MSIBF_01515 [Candidatus Altiarchaeales archaeon IMC4]|nr:MAG: hypothetical protein MSIBF_01515 [Candidatus Altiarchaeales archaeon IMC4]